MSCGLSFLSALLLCLAIPVVGAAGAPVPHISEAAAQAPSGSDGEDVATDGDSTAGRQLVKVTIATSRSEVTSEGGFGIFADLQNVSPVPLKMRAAETMLVIQPELAGDHNCILAVDGFYATEGGGTTAGNSSGEIIIQPREHYVAFWDVSGSNLGQCKPATAKQDNTDAKRRWFTWHPMAYLLNQLAFVPGNYAFVVVGKAYRVPNGQQESIYHTYTDQVKLHVGLTQFDAMLAAMLGGVIGYIVVALRDGGDFSKYTFASGTYLEIVKSYLIVLRNMFSAALVSAVVTILLSRISDTQFPIKVSVADFWGALTVGFVAYFVGNKLIDRIVGLAFKGKP
jgi:hypothetical protein